MKDTGKDIILIYIYFTKIDPGKDIYIYIYIYIYIKISSTQQIKKTNSDSDA